MRWILPSLALVACGDNNVMVPATVVRAGVSTTCTGSACALINELGAGACGYDLPVITPDTTRIQAITSIAPEALAGIVQVQYTTDGSLGRADGPVHTDFTLAHGGTSEIYAALDYELLLYRISANGEPTDISPFLESTDGRTLKFAYAVNDLAIHEEHAVGAPRPLVVETESGIMDTCCSAGGPPELGIVAAAVVLGLRRRRRS